MRQAVILVLCSNSFLFGIKGMVKIRPTLLPVVNAVLRHQLVRPLSLFCDILCQLHISRPFFLFFSSFSLLSDLKLAAHKPHVQLLLYYPFYSLHEKNSSFSSFFVFTKAFYAFVELLWFLFAKNIIKNNDSDT